MNQGPSVDIMAGRVVLSTGWPITEDDLAILNVLRSHVTQNATVTG